MMRWHAFDVERGDGLALRVRDSGEENLMPCLLIHGFGDGAFIWDQFTPSLKGRYRVMTIDLRGHGESAWSTDGSYSVQAHVQDVMAAIDFLALKAFVLIGHSLGGEIALHIAAAYPERVERLVVVDFGPGRDPAAGEAIISAVKDSLRVYQSIDEYVSWYTSNRPLTSAAVARVLAHGALCAQSGGGFAVKIDPAILTSRTEHNDDEAVWTMLKAIRCHTLVVRGNGSAVLKNTVARQMAGVLRSGHLEVVRPAGHAIMTDSPEGFVAATHPFLCSSDHS